MYDSPQVREENVLRSSLAKTSLSCSKARYYNPNISEDPLRFFASPNFYPYVLNDPLTFLDPLGLDAITQDANALACFKKLWEETGSGWFLREASAWLVEDKEKPCGVCPGKKGYNEAKINFSIKDKPENAIALVHTHPTRYRGPSGSILPEPSKPDRATSNVLRVDVYVLTHLGIWKFEQVTQKTTQEEGPEWLSKATGKCTHSPDCPK